MQCEYECIAQDVHRKGNVNTNTPHGKSTETGLFTNTSPRPQSAR